MNSNAMNNNQQANNTEGYPFLKNFQTKLDMLVKNTVDEALESGVSSADLDDVITEIRMLGAVHLCPNELGLQKKQSSKTKSGKKRRLAAWNIFVRQKNKDQKGSFKDKDYSAEYRRIKETEPEAFEQLQKEADKENEKTQSTQIGEDGENARVKQFKELKEKIYTTMDDLRKAEYSTHVLVVGVTNTPFPLNYPPFVLTNSHFMVQFASHIALQLKQISLQDYACRYLQSKGLKNVHPIDPTTVSNIEEQKRIKNTVKANIRESASAKFKAVNRDAKGRVSWTKLLRNEDAKYGIKWPEDFPKKWNDKGNFNLDGYSDVQLLELEQLINGGGVKFYEKKQEDQQDQ